MLSGQCAPKKKKKKLLKSANRVYGISDSEDQISMPGSPVNAPSDGKDRQSDTEASSGEQDMTGAAEEVTPRTSDAGGDAGDNVTARTTHSQRVTRRKRLRKSFS